ncbi:MAG: hypothetical protein JWQ20_1227 [Conexibacter sp.]|nr:hypothetical protein [Conexibacter sp.]
MTPLDLLPDKTRKAAAEQLRADDEVLGVINGSSKQAIVALADRILVIKPGFMAGATFGASVTAFPYRNISAIEVNVKMFNGVIELVAAGYDGRKPTDFWSSDKNKDPFKLSNCLPITKDIAKKAGPVLDLIRDRIAQAHAPAVHAAPPAADGIGDQLAKLADLHAAGVLTEAEFTQAKSRLLS